MRALVTGANGFVGPYLVKELVRSGFSVTAGIVPAEFDRGVPGMEGMDARPVDVTDLHSTRAVVDAGYTAVIHLAGVSSGAAALGDPGLAWEVNAAGTARLVSALASSARARATLEVFLHVSTLEVYGVGPPIPRTEGSELRPASPYAASKAGGELAAMEVHRRTGLPVVIARPAAHTGPGQLPRYVVPAFANRLMEARRSSMLEVPVGNLEPVRDLLHVEDVVAAYTKLIASGRPGEAYNVGSGLGFSMSQVFGELAAQLCPGARPKADPELVRKTEVPHLVADPSKILADTGWRARIPFEEIIRQVATHALSSY